MASVCSITKETDYLTSAISSQQVDFGKQSENYATFRPGFPERFYDKLAAYIDVKGKKVLDIGSGPGVMALEFAKRGAEVVGLDIAKNQIEVAKKQAIKLGVQDRTRFGVAPSENTGEPSKTYSLITAGTCWHWFDKVKVSQECHRLLLPGGLLVVAQYIYIPEPNTLAEETERLILKYNPSWPLHSSTGLYPELVIELKREGFELVEQFCFDHQQGFTQESWLGRILTCNGVGSGALDTLQLEKFSAELKELMASKYPVQVFVTHRVFAVIVKEKESNE